MLLFPFLNKSFNEALRKFITEQQNRNHTQTSQNQTKPKQSKTKRTSHTSESCVFLCKAYIILIKIFLFPVLTKYSLLGLTTDVPWPKSYRDTVIQLPVLSFFTEKATFLLHVLPCICWEKGIAPFMLLLNFYRQRLSYFVNYIISSWQKH